MIDSNTGNNIAFDAIKIGMAQLGRACGITVGASVVALLKQR